MKKCYPDKQYNSVTEITLEELSSMGIKGLIMDIDNTLTFKDRPEVLPEVKEWITLLKSHYIQLAIVSNNKRERVEPFARNLSVMYFYRSMKPLKRGFRKAQKMFCLKSNQIAVVGDQIYTDVYGAKRCGMKALFVYPMELEDGPFFRLKRKMECKYVNHSFLKGNKENREESQ